MFCPKCKSEYRVGFVRCADCDVDLVDELPRETEEDVGEEEYVSYQPVLSTFNYSDISFIKSVLDGEDIHYYFKGEYFHLARPGIEPAVLMVQDDHVEKAMTLLKDVDLSYLLFNSAEGPRGEGSK